MGNSFACLPPRPARRGTSRSSRSSSPKLVPAADGNRTGASLEKAHPTVNDDQIREQALEAVLLLRRHQSIKSGNTSLLDRSTSVRNSVSATSKKKQANFPRSSSTRSSFLTDTVLQPNLLVDDQTKSSDSLETRHFVLVHGGGFGAWCWYKTIALLKQSGFEVDAVDLTGSGIHSSDVNGVTNLAQYVKPLTDLLEKLGDGEKVILVGHDFGGTCISYAMELFPSKVAKAVFVAAVMLAGEQSTVDVFSLQGAEGLLRQGKVAVYGNGNELPPTAVEFDKSSVQDMLFNQSPDKDVALASVSMRPIPWAPVVERLPLSVANYGSVRRFYVKTADDRAVPVVLQEAMIGGGGVPPERVFQVKGSDHSPFFSKPQGLHKVLLDIAMAPPGSGSSPAHPDPGVGGAHDGVG